MNELSIYKNQIVYQGIEIHLKGVSKSGLEYLYIDYERYLEEMILLDIQTMKQWGLNCVRLPLRNSHWMNEKYQEIVHMFIYHLHQHDFFIILDLHTLNDSYGLDLFMIKDDKAYNALRFWKMIATTFRSVPTIMYELFNEPHLISPSTWWYGDEYYFGYKEIVLAIRSITSQIIILNGLDYAYQLHFLQHEKAILDEIKTYSNIAFGSHPYAYKGYPSPDHQNTIPFPTVLHNHTSCIIGYTEPLWTTNYTQGWNDSFAFLHLTQQFPVIITEFGLDRYETSLQGGWYADELLRYIDKHGLHFVAWAWVADRLDYPSLIRADLQPTGTASLGDQNAPCSVHSNHHYPGPGLLVYHYLNPNRTMIYHPPSNNTNVTTAQYSSNFFIYILFCFFSIVFFYFTYLRLFRFIFDPKITFDRTEQSSSSSIQNRNEPSTTTSTLNNDIVLPFEDNDV